MLDYAIFFIVYAFFGWVCEEIYCSIKQKKLVTRGFLYGPVCPIYGIGAILIIFFLSPYKEHWYFLFFIALVALSLLEYLTSYFMEKIFRMRWWDYSNHRLNINGRVCLWNSVLFGLLAMMVIYLIHPGILSVSDIVVNNLKIVFVIITYSIFFIDLVVSVVGATRTSSTVRKYVQAIKDGGHNLKEKIVNTKFPGFFFRHTLRNFPKIFHMRSRISLKDLITRIRNKDKNKEENPQDNEKCDKI